MQNIILGINAFHGDSSAALLVDGRLVAAVEEERFNRVKHWAGFPAESIRWCLGQAGVAAGDIDHVSVSFNPRANWQVKAGFALRNFVSARDYILARAKRQGKQRSLRQSLADALGCPEATIRAQFHSVEHHQAHVASGLPVSPFDDAAVLSVDGMGDFVSTMMAGGGATDWQVFSKIYYPHSIGLLYSAMTMYLGFLNYGDEYKVMGLAPYGKPNYVDQMRRMIPLTADGFRLNLDYFRHHREGIRLGWQGGSPDVAPFYSQRLVAELGPVREARAEVTEKHQDIAASLQVVTEDVIMHLLKILHRMHPSDNLVMVGGVAMNSVANGKITSRTPFKNVYIPPGAADNGGSFGSAYYVWHRILGRKERFHLDHALWGPGVDDAACEAAIREAKLPVRKLSEAQLIQTAIDTMVRGEIIGWFQGRMEFGARALGSRSLLADPRRTDIRDIVNLKIKFREKFRPFAPSILEEYAAEYFERDEPAPYMEKVFKIKPEKRALIPAVTHVDGTGRLQTVSKRTSPLYWKLIDGFRVRTGIPLVLNTSLNENEPIVNTPKEALSCFLRTRMDAIALGSYWVTRE